MAQIIVGDKSAIKDFPFEDEVHDMGDFVATHPDILGPEVTIIARELQVPTVAGQKRMDFLAIDTENNQVDIVELKKNLADEKVLLQTLRYANWIRNNPDTVRYQVKRQNKDINAEEIETDSIKVIIIAHKISRSLAELCQYITAFDFEFIELQRFKDPDGKVYAVTDRVEVEPIEPSPTRTQGTYDLAWYKERGVGEQQIGLLKSVIDELTAICAENDWDIGPRYVKWSVRFQTPGGRNALCIHVRKTKNHHCTLCLGDDFDMNRAKVLDAVKKVFVHKKGSRWWKTDLVPAEMKKIVPLLEIAYQNITQ